MIKDERQDIGIQKWIDNDHNGILNYIMRFGKTYTAIKAYHAYCGRSIKNAIVLVPSQIIHSQWKLEIKLKVRESLKSNIKVLTISEAINKDNLECDLLIVDEAHKFISDERIRYINNEKIKYKNILMLTGTPPDRKKGVNLYSICPIVDTITEEEAIKNKWISPVIEYNIPLELSEHDKEVYAALSKPIRETLSTFSGTEKLIPSAGSTPFNVIIACFRGIVYKDNGKTYRISGTKVREYLAKQKGWHKDVDITTKYGKNLDNYWNPNSIYDRVKEFNECIRKRNELLTNNTIKLNAVLTILKYSFPTTICFNESTIFADTLNNVVNKTFPNSPSVCYHSNIKSRNLIDMNGNVITYITGKNAGKPKKFGKTTLKKLAVEGMNKGAYKLLCTAKALDEGLDIPTIEQVITTSGTTNPIQYKQRSSRGRTIDVYNPNKVTKIFNLYFKDFSYIKDVNGEERVILVTSRDRVKLHERQKDSSEVVWLNSLANIAEIFENNGQNT